MQKAEILGKLKEAIIDLDDEEVARLIGDGLKAGLAPMNIIFTRGIRLCGWPAAKVR